MATKAKSKVVKAMLMAAKDMGFEADFRFLGNERVCVDGEVQRQEGDFVRPHDVSVTERGMARTVTLSLNCFIHHF